MTDTAVSIADEIMRDLSAEGLAARFTLIKAGEPTGDAWNPTSGADVTYTGTCVSVQSAEAERAGILLAEGERVFRVWGLAATPTVADRASFHGRADKWQVKEVVAVYFGEDVLAYLIKVVK